jgi:uncharacterized membrane protein
VILFYKLAIYPLQSSVKKPILAKSAAKIVTTVTKDTMAKEVGTGYEGTHESSRGAT